MNTKIDGYKGHESKRILNSESPSFNDQPNLDAIQGDSSLVHISIFFHSPSVSQRIYSLFQAGKEFVKKEKPPH